MKQVIIEKIFYLLGGGTIPILSYYLGKKARIIKNRKEDAVADQEEIKTKKAELELAIGYQDFYKSMVESFAKRIDDLEAKYSEIVLKNRVLEERAETREKQYKILQGEYSVLDEKYNKLHKENITIKKEIEKLKNKD
jgi:chromosome segregation ATPase